MAAHNQSTGDQPTRPRPTLAQIASELGVSVMSVSNAYNRPDQLSTALRERILAKAQELGYPGPDPLGRGLRRRRTGALGVLYDTWPAYVFQSPAAVFFLQGLTETTGRAFIGVLLVPSPLPEDTGAPPLDTALVDGFVVYSVADTDRQVPVARRRGPVVVVDQPRIEGVPTVGIDDEAAAAGAAQHLIDLGHRRIAVLAFGFARDGVQGFAGVARQQHAAFAVTRARLAGYRSALTAAGIDWDGTPVYECHTLRDAPAAAGELLALRPRPTAILAMSDGLALGAVRAATDLDLTVPADLSVIGFDDTPRGQRTELTSVHQPHLAKGRRAGEMLLGLLAGEPVADRELLPTELIVRGSTGPARS